MFFYVDKGTVLCYFIIMNTLLKEDSMKIIDEQTLDRGLKRKILLCSLAGILILAAGIMILNILDRSLTNLTAEQMETETNEYKKRIMRQTEADFQALDTLAAVFEYADLMDEEGFDEYLHQANTRNDFVTMAYFDISGIGTIVYTDRKIRRNVDYFTLDENVRQVIETAFKGEQSFSKLFSSEIAPEMIYAYGVPVYRKGGEIAGALVAGSTIDTFMDIVHSEGVLVGDYAIHLISENGQMLLSSSVRDKSSIPEDILHSEYFSVQEQAKIDQARAAEETLFTKMTYDEREYKVFLNPVGFNGWYIMYVNAQKSVSRIAYVMVNVVGCVFIILLVIILSLLIHICRMMIKNNKKLLRFAYIDHLTGADNVIRFSQRLQTISEKKDGFCLIALNVHHFKFINEIFGEQAADQLLLKICELIGSFTAENEYFCRESGDLFYLLLRDTDEKIVKTRVEGLMEEISSRHLLDKSDYHISMYAGALIRTGKEKDTLSNEMLITRTRFAMQSGKKLPGNRLHFYDKEIHKNEELENYVEAHMQQALQNGDFKMYLQPKILLSDKSLSSAEALVRWITEDGRIIYPNTFIPLFERNGFCVQLDLYMAEQAFCQIRRWMDEGIDPVPISVNQSKLLFYDPGYLDYLQMLLDKYRVPAGLITLEILESVALDRADEINTKLRCIRSMGFRISLDDFGSGYASFHTLGCLEIDELKLDRSFLLEASSYRESRFATIMEYIVGLSKNLGIKTVAEGVETPENEALIKKIGCNYGQGFLYSRPVSVEEFEKKYMK